MAIVKKCDRCGKVYDTPEKTAVLSAFEKMAKAVYGFTDVTYSIREKITECVDFCPECEDSLEKWFKNPENPEETEPPTDGERCAICGEIISEGREKLVCPWCACGIHNDSPSRAPEKGWADDGTI